MVWQLGNDGENPGQAVRSLKGHNHFVSDVTLSNDGAYCLSSSWDGTLRLWDIVTGDSQKTFVGHSKDVLSVAFSPDNRQIVSGSRDKSIKLWNTIGECKFTIENAHADWVSCVRFSPNAENPVVVSAGWDKNVKVTSITNLKQRTDLAGHSGYLNTVTVSPDGSLCASGGKDGVANLWDLNEGKVSSLPADKAPRGSSPVPMRAHYTVPTLIVTPLAEAVLPGVWQCDPLPVLQPQQVLAVRCHQQEHHHLGPRVQGCGG